MTMLEAKTYIRYLKLKEADQLDWSAYPHAITVVNDIEKLEFHADVTFFVGENGSGKFTILDEIALAKLLSKC